ncbi:sigma factor [Stutzerimonas kirkiae]|uniref:sigma factor n=1 Tax=Stutzerimonas kirkiae TaxID=2211392 RepID=UPI003BF9C212
MNQSPRSDLDRLYRNHNLRLQGWLRRQTECPQLAADLMQDTYLRILASSSALALLRELREPRNYLTTVARRVLFDRLRRQRLERATSKPWPFAPNTRQSPRKNGC